MNPLCVIVLLLIGSICVYIFDGNVVRIVGGGEKNIMENYNKICESEKCCSILASEE